MKRLQAQYPDLSVSKVRYLEDEGLITPSRTPGGYRLYSQHDIRRLESVLFLQKNRFMPLQVIKEELKKGDVILEDAAGATQAQAGTADVASPALRPSGDNDSPVSGQPVASTQLDSQETLEKYHPLSRMPELLNVSVGFVRELSQAGVIEFRTSPHGRELVDGHDFPLIRTCEELRRYGIAPRNLRQYVQAANRESGMLEQALTVYGHNASGGGLAMSPEQEERYDQALRRMMGLTNNVRESLIRKRLRSNRKG